MRFAGCVPTAPTAPSHPAPRNRLGPLPGPPRDPTGAWRSADREELSEAHHEHDVAGHLVLAVHETIAAALLAAGDGEPEVGVDRERDRRLDRTTVHDAARAVMHDDRPLTRLSSAEVEEDDRFDADGRGGVEHLR